MECRKYELTRHAFLASSKANVDVDISDQHGRDDDDVDGEGHVRIERALQVVEHADHCDRLVFRLQDPRSNPDRQKYRSWDEHVDEHRYQHLTTNIESCHQPIPPMNHPKS